MLGDKWTFRKSLARLDETMRHALGWYALSIIAIAGMWAWLGAEVPMPPAPLASNGKVYCVSYAPFRGGQTPLDRGTEIDPRQIEDDLTRLKAITDCVRTYSTDFNLDKVPGIAQRLGLQVIQGLWLSGEADRNEVQIDAAIRLARTYPNVIRAIVVGNEALLRGEISATDLARTIRAVKAQVEVPVTYADVWEYWLRHRDLANVVDFVTIHILPYWEDFPVAANAAAAHVDAIQKRVADAFPGKEVLIGEFGWPSRGRMRAGALPSPANQARVLHEVLAQAQRGEYRVNLIEAFDQPWKRHLEGTVGGYWGLYDNRSRRAKFVWGAAVSNHPHWPWQTMGGFVLATLTFGAAMLVTRRQRHREPTPHRVWPAMAIIATTAGICIGWAVESMLIEAFNLGGWLHSLALVAVASVAPLAAAAALSSDSAIPNFAALLSPEGTQSRDPITLVCGWVFIATTVLTLQSALGLAFNPRYRDFPDAALTVAIVPLLMVSVLVPQSKGRAGTAEALAAAVLLLSSGYILFNEGFSNWQSLWFCALLLALAVILRRARGAPG